MLFLPLKRCNQPLPGWKLSCPMMSTNCFALAVRTAPPTRMVWPPTSMNHLYRACSTSGGAAPLKCFCHPDEASAEVLVHSFSLLFMTADTVDWDRLYLTTTDFTRTLEQWLSSFMSRLMPFLFNELPDNADRILLRQHQFWKCKLWCCDVNRQTLKIKGVRRSTLSSNNIPNVQHDTDALQALRSSPLFMFRNKPWVRLLSFVSFTAVRCTWLDVTGCLKPKLIQKPDICHSFHYVCVFENYLLFRLAVRHAVHMCGAQVFTDRIWMPTEAGTTALADATSKNCMNSMVFKDHGKSPQFFQTLKICLWIPGGSSISKPVRAMCIPSNFIGPILVVSEKVNWCRIWPLTNYSS